MNAMDIKSKQMKKDKVSKKHNKKLEKSQYNFQNNINTFIKQIDSLSIAMKLSQQTIFTKFEESGKILNNLIIEKKISTSKDDEYSFLLKPQDLNSFKLLAKDITAAVLSIKNIPRIYFCAIIHQYDAYLGRLLKTAYNIKPELLNTSQKQLSFSDLQTFPSIDAARDRFIEKEIETVIRDSHSAHFDWMEKAFKISLREDLSIWPDFIEFTERRNLFVHCDGIVSSQYLTTCKCNKIEFKKTIKVGDELDVSQVYFNKAVDCILEIGIKLGHVLWRKLQPDDVDTANDALHNTTFELLSDERYLLASKLLIFATENKKIKFTDLINRINLINLAIAYYYLNKKDETIKIIESQDWTASKESLQLAVAVLQDKYDDAALIMRNIGQKGEITCTDYSSWPLFKNFRKTPQFLITYKEMFGEEFVLEEKNMETLLKKTTNKSSFKRK